MIDLDAHQTPEWRCGPFSDLDVIIANEFHQPDDELIFFQQTDRAKVMPPDTDFWDVLVLAGVFTSRSEARRNHWPRAIPPGWTARSASCEPAFAF